VQLALTTNTQFLDEEKLEQVADHVEMVVMSIDSHVPEVFEKIRLGAKAEKVFGNARTIARLCQEHGIECIGQAVFMTENAPMMPETIAWFADIGVSFVSVIALNDTNRRSWHLDAALHFSAEYLDWIKNRCVAAAEEKKIRLTWFLSDYEHLDFREDRTVGGSNETKAWNDRWDTHMSFRHPGYCRFAYDRLRVEVEGNVSPCGMDSPHELELGNLATEDFADMWNGPTAQDLRRAHYTWDYPSLCKTCRYTDKPPAQDVMRFSHDFMWSSWAMSYMRIPATLSIEEPEHLTRAIDAPTIRLVPPEPNLGPYVVALSLGGELDEVQVFGVEPTALEDGTVEIGFPADRWNALRTNVGYWWTAFAFRWDLEEPNAPPVARTEVRCLVRDEPLPRIEGSRLRYPDEGHFPGVYLGGQRQVGWTERGKLPERPPLSGSGIIKSNGRTRFAKLRKAPAAPAPGAKMTPAAYMELVERIRAVVNSALPADASLIVASKGDKEILYYDGRPAWHFPCDETHEYAGYHPPDSDAAIGQLERARREGAQFLLLPVTAYWWLDHYAAFAEYLRARYPAIVEDIERCTIFDLRET
jgi:radical SAM protein with 4Fe4S-binding SPASM domain